MQQGDVNWHRSIFTFENLQQISPELLLLILNIYIFVFPKPCKPFPYQMQHFLKKLATNNYPIPQILHELFGSRPVLIPTNPYPN